MLERGKMDRGVLEIVDTESLVPSEHLLRKIDAAVDFNRLYEMVEPLYCEDNGRPSIDPVVLFKMVLFSICTDCRRCGDSGGGLPQHCVSLVSGVHPTG